jgi:phosphatidate cytidylyltransferase
MLGWRLIVSAILIPSLFGVFWLDNRAGDSAPWLFALCLVLAVRSSWEFTDLLRTRSLSPAFIPCAIGSALVVVAAWLGHWRPEWFGGGTAVAAMGPVGAAFGVCLLALFAMAAARFSEPGRTMEQTGSEVLCIAYCGLLLAITAQLRWIAGGALGYVALGSLVIATKAGDIGGYTLGRLFGKRKMAPRLSPGKTWAGFVGAVLGAILGAWLWLTLASPSLAGAGFTASTVRVLLFGAAMGIVGLLGDLCESLIKRDVGRKDAAALFPGFGGLLDLLDSVIYAGPIAWLWWVYWPPILRAL